MAPELNHRSGKNIYGDPLYSSGRRKFCDPHVKPQIFDLVYIEIIGQQPQYFTPAAKVSPLIDEANLASSGDHNRTSAGSIFDHPICGSIPHSPFLPGQVVKKRDSRMRLNYDAKMREQVKPQGFMLGNSGKFRGNNMHVRNMLENLIADDGIEHGIVERNPVTFHPENVWLRIGKKIGCVITALPKYVAPECLNAQRSEHRDNVSSAATVVENDRRFTSDALLYPRDAEVVVVH